MKNTLSAGKLIAVGLMLLAMFLGAGNTIFAPMVGQLAGTNTWIAMSGFLVTGVGLVLLAIIALAISGGTVENLAARVHPKFGMLFSIALFLTLGPIYVIPRTTSVVYEISVDPIITEMTQSNHVFLFLFSFLFILMTVLLSLNPSKFVDRLGKMITPIFVTLLMILIVKSFMTPMGSFGEPREPYTQDTFFKGFVQGYYTMDVLAAFTFGGIFIKSIKNVGVEGKKEISIVFMKAGMITVVGLVLLQLSLAWIGASSVDAIGYASNGGEVLGKSAIHLFGYVGIFLIGTVIFLTGITTNIACLSSVAEYFNRIYPNISYKKWVILLAVISLIITNFGLNTILELASPILLLLYPIAITLIILSFINNLFKGFQSVYIGSIIGSGFVALLDALKEANVFADFISHSFSFIPLFNIGAGWIITGLIGAVIGMIIAILNKSEERKLDIGNEEVS
ncbi:branched-chain amino acid transport system II carrier protein [Bacillus swezeyi]|uniref:Branched-chain amino acid transport system carrier protein n=1 Tax=Bacillus swezeyi TaxID=1925020 RepID=A0A1R1QIW2_9BACI|nr:branched-chain amino acid transport system II carrier protein [Bacillus swezeyi]MEC1260363.1 branched-chain amino acid transport system II carrier protein [Bacillus swezeyi]MED2929465.1 branched-chain amino acid transport system II carrier protein [Bacillus swezeyi]MED2941277.1 branched-chain amino acid transport system II carrier protein [Bacillus swezeyi]MED2963508.1 branched-chain amino acid transport system II carrier protein [Bacillus swezeyi]MED2975759.1 branched-chain amino acid tran